MQPYVNHQEKVRKQVRQESYTSDDEVHLRFEERNLHLKLLTRDSSITQSSHKFFSGQPLDLHYMSEVTKMKPLWALLSLRC